MSHPFTFETSEPLTLGIEEELFLLPAERELTGMVPRADEVLNGDFQTIAVPGGWLKPELLRSTVELATATASGLPQLDVDLHALRDELVARADAVGLRVATMGMHPLHKVTESSITPTSSHRATAELFDRVGTLRDQVTHGIHVHVGMPNLRDAVLAMDAIAAQVPLIIALTANSPIVCGERAPWMSARAELLRAMQWGGPPPRFDSAQEYESVHALHQLESGGEQRFLWEVAPVPALGTIELRSADANADPAVALGIAALVQAIAARSLDGLTPARAHASLERHNRWSATEFGPRARFLVPGRDAPVDAAELARDLIAQLRPWAQALGTEPWFEVFERLLLEPPAQAAIEAYEAGGVAAVLDAATLEPVRA
ncbi:MAG: Enzymatic protein of unknown function [Thermoleophilia bacterium]|nr:Enzymatic protein of unknown function [Thermoleophilia bacterium]